MADIKDFVTEQDVLKRYQGSDRDVVIPDGITIIGNVAFYGCSSLTSITIPDSVTGIGNGAFYGCSNLMSVTIPDSVISIGARAFSGCNKLSGITIPDSVRSLGRYAFEKCNHLETISIGGNVEHIDKEVFPTDTDFDFIVRGKPSAGLLEFFSRQPLLLNKAYFPDLLCSEVPENAQKHMAIRIVDAIGKGETVSEPVYRSYVKYIAMHKMDWIAEYQKETIPVLRLLIKEKKLGITEIDEVIDNVSKLSEPELLSQLMVYRLEKQSRLAKRNETLLDDTASQKYINAMWSVGRKEPLVKSYKDVRETVTFPMQVGKTTVTGIADNFEFKGGQGQPRSLVKEVVIPEGYTSIGISAFSYCENLLRVSLPHSLTRIGSSAFRDCKSLKSIEIPGSVANVDYGTFSDCTDLSGVIIHEGVKSIGRYAFSGCENLTQITLPESVIHIGTHAFSECRKLREIRFGGKAPAIEDDAFEGCYEMPFLRDKDKFLKMFAFGETVSYGVLKSAMEFDDATSDLARRLIWDAEGVRFFMDGNECITRSGVSFTPMGNITLAHPVELDAEEIQFWQEQLAARHIIQPFRQMWEPVVLRSGTLCGTISTVESAKNKYEMSDRYAGAILNADAIRTLEKHGFRFITRESGGYDDRYGRFVSSGIHVVNIVTPMGILYNCKPLGSRDALSKVSLGLLLPFDHVRLRIANHSAAMLEQALWPWLIQRDRLEDLLPHMASANAYELREMYKKAAGASDKIAAAICEIARHKGIRL